jgi:hypothetical protein
VTEVQELKAAIQIASFSPADCGKDESDKVRKKQTNN